MRLMVIVAVPRSEGECKVGESGGEQGAVRAESSCTGG